MRYKGIIFDLDGVICSTDEYHYLAWKALADRLHIPFDRERNNLLRGVSRMASLEIILGDRASMYSEAEKITLTKEKNNRYRDLLSQMSHSDLSEEVMETLCTLRDHGIKLAIGSSSKNAPLILEKIGLSQFFDAVIDGNCITHSKPNPEVFLKAAQLLDLPSESCLVVEDANAGVEAAVSGGFDCASIGSAKNNPKAIYHLTQFSDLLDADITQQSTSL